MASIPLAEFDAQLKARFIEVSSASLGGVVLSCSDDFFVSKDNLIKAAPSASMKGQFGPNGALYDGWESRRHNPTFDWAIILLAPGASSVEYVDIDTSHFSGNEAPASEVFAVRLDEREREAYRKVAAGGRGRQLGAADPRWTQILPFVTLGPNSRHIFKVEQGGMWSALMVRMIPDGGMARFRAYGHPLPLAVPATLPDSPPINLLSPLVSGHIVACSDANFSPPQNLLLPGRGHDMSDGWETRRSQVGRGKYGPGGALEGQERKEWVVGKLGATGVVRFVEVDSAYHVGNYPVACQIEATLCDDEVPPADAAWTVLVRKQPLGPHRQHWFDVERGVNAVFSHVRCSIYPDGGLKRLRIFGLPLAPSPSPPTPAHVPALPLTYEAFAPYGHVIQGWDLPTSAPKGIHVNVANQGTAFKFHRLAAVVDKFGAEGKGVKVGCVRQAPFVDVRQGAQVEVKMLERHLKYSQAFIPQGKGGSALKPGGAFLVVVALNGADDKPDLSTLRAFLATEAQGVSYSPGVWHHRLLTVNETVDYAFVDAQSGDFEQDTEILTPPEPYAVVDVEPYVGGAAGATPTHASTGAARPAPAQGAPAGAPAGEPAVPVPITHAAFAPFGALIRAYPDGGAPTAATTSSSPAAAVVVKHDALADVTTTYPADSNAVTGIAVFRATKKVGLERGKTFDVRYMERHPYTTQAFIPMGKAEWTGRGESKLPGTGAFLVIVAENGADDKPDPRTLKTFTMESSCGLSYAPGVWHHPVLVLDDTLDLACVETQVSTGVPEPDARDCELLEWEGDEVFGQVAVPL